MLEIQNAHDARHRNNQMVISQPMNVSARDEDEQVTMESLILI